jgi:chromosome segregation ATPase
VDPATQRRRDDSRRKILEDELASEERSLAEARKALSEGEATRLGSERNYQRYLDRIQGLKDRVAQHERNVNALKQELANLR